MAGRFDCERVLRFDSLPHGIGRTLRRKRWPYETLVTVSIEGLNILDMVTADRIVARLISKHPQGDKKHPSTLPDRTLRTSGSPAQSSKPSLHACLFAVSQILRYRFVHSMAANGEDVQIPERKEVARGSSDLLETAVVAGTCVRTAPERVAKFLPEEPAGRRFRKIQSAVQRSSGSQPADLAGSGQALRSYHRNRWLRR